MATPPGDRPSTSPAANPKAAPITGMPMIGACFGLAAGLVLGLSPGGVAMMMVLAASSSYIAVPAAMRVALPQANPALSLTLSLGITFPFNLTIGIPAYIAVAQAVTGG